MKTLLPILFFLLSTGLTFGQETPSPVEEVSKSDEISDETYQNIANDMCSCFNTATEGISDKMRVIIEGSGKNRTNLQEDIKLYLENAVDSVADDIAILSEMGGDELMSCIDNLALKYPGIGIDNSEEKLMRYFEKTKVCALTYAFLLEGLRQ